MAVLKDDDDRDQIDGEALTQEISPEERLPEVVDTDAEQQDERLHEEEGDERGEEGEQKEDKQKRESARDRRLRAKQAKQRDKDELALLRLTVDRLNTDNMRTQRALIEARVTSLKRDAQTAKEYVDQWNDVDIKATAAKEINDARQARLYRDQAAAEHQKLIAQAEQLQAQLGKPLPAERPVPTYADKAQRFLSDKPWYNPQAGDRDSLIVQALDVALGKKMSPDTEDYWKELDKQVKQTLPHKFENSDDDADEDDEVEDTPPVRKGPPTGGSNRGGAQVKEIRLPAAYVASLKEAGMWEDPKQRARMAKRYAETVKANSRG